MFRIKSLFDGRVALFFVCLLLVAGGQSLVAQSKQVANDTTLKQEADALIADLTARGEGLRALQKKIEASEGERRAIFRNELLRRWKGFAQKLDELVANISQQKAKGIDPGEQLTAAKQMTSAVAEGLSDAAIAREAAITKLEDRLAAAGSDEKAQLQQEVRRENGVYQSLLTSIVDNVERMKKLDIPSAVYEEQVDALLQDRAQIVEGRLRLIVDHRNEVKEQARRAVEADKPVLQKDLSDTTRRLTFWADALRGILDQMDRRGLDTTSRRELLVKTTGEVAPGTLDTKVAVGLIQQAISDGNRWLRENGPRMLVHFLVVLLILAAFWFLSKVAGRVTRAAVSSDRLSFSKLLQEFFVTVVSRTILGIGVIVALAQIGFDLAPLLAGLGIAGFIVGFALQDTLSNFASGMMILGYRPYDVGDAVEVAGVLGVVSEMNLVSTTIKTFDNQKLIVPNSKIWGNVIRNLTAENTRRVDLVFGISYGDDIAKAEALLREEVEKHELVLAEPEPVIRVSELADSSVNFIVRPWSKTVDYWTVYWDLTRNVKLRFDEEGITIPFPQRDVHMHKTE